MGTTNKRLKNNYYGFLLLMIPIYNINIIFIFYDVNYCVIYSYHITKLYIVCLYYKCVYNIIWNINTELCVVYVSKLFINLYMFVSLVLLVHIYTL